MQSIVVRKVILITILLLFFNTEGLKESHVAQEPQIADSRPKTMDPIITAILGIVCSKDEPQSFEVSL